MASTGLKYQFARLSIAEKLIAINVIVFLVNRLVPFLMGFHVQAIERWFWLPKDLGTFITQPWSLITYGFFHGGFWHILSNMIILYFSSRIFLNLFDDRKFINVYFLGIVLGGLMFIVSYNVFPVFTAKNLPLVGASAGVMAVLIFICTYIPNQEIRFFVVNIKLWYIGAFFVLKDLVQMSYGDNAGGHLAHLGGALLGYLYARQLTKGNDIGEGFSKVLDGLGNMFKPKKQRKAPLKTVYKTKKTATKVKTSYTKDSHQKKIDTILDKISKSGYESLSKAEKDFLFKAGKED